MLEWTKTADRLPEPGLQVLTHIPGRPLRTGYYKPDCTCTAKWHISGECRVPDFWAAITPPQEAI